MFETDVVKYQLYNRACYEALKDLMKVGQGAKVEDPVVAMVVGAGRGPLVTEFIDAAVALGVFYKVCERLALPEYGFWDLTSLEIFFPDMCSFPFNELSKFL